MAFSNLRYFHFYYTLIFQVGLVVYILCQYHIIYFLSFCIQYSTRPVYLVFLKYCSSINNFFLVNLYFSFLIPLFQLKQNNYTCLNACVCIYIMVEDSCWFSVSNIFHLNLIYQDWEKLIHPNLNFLQVKFC